jgi:hypothetical protein
VEIFLGQQVIRRPRAGRSTWGHSDRKFASLQLVVNVGTEFEELDAGKALQLIASLVRWGLRVAIARCCREVALERDIVL